MVSYMGRMLPIVFSGLSVFSNQMLNKESCSYPQEIPEKGDHTLPNVNGT